MSNTLDLNDNDGLRAAAEALRSSGWLRFATIVEQHIAEVERLRAEVSYLRACVPPVHPGDYGHEAWIEGVRAAVAEERAAVVAWLRALTVEWSPGTVAYAIERGEHRREEER